MIRLKPVLLRRALLAAMPALLVATLSWSFALVWALSIMTLNLSRWVRRARLREACEVAAFIAPGLAAIVAWVDGEPRVEAVAFLRLALAILALLVASAAWLVAVLSTPAWTLRAACRGRTRAHTERATWRDLPELMYVVRHWGVALKGVVRVAPSPPARCCTTCSR